VADLICATCLFWSERENPAAYYGDCALQVVYGRVAFDYQPCPYHSERGGSVPRDYSGDRGMTLAAWQKRLQGKA